MKKKIYTVIYLIACICVAGTANAQNEKQKDIIFSPNLNLKIVNIENANSISFDLIKLDSNKEYMLTAKKITNDDSLVIFTIFQGKGDKVNSGLLSNITISDTQLNNWELSLIIYGFNPDGSLKEEQKILSNLSIIKEGGFKPEGQK